MELLLGIDIGTTHCKVGVYNEKGEKIILKKVKTETHTNKEGWSWYEADEIWLAVTKLLQEISTYINTRKIIACSIASIGESGVPIDKKGNATYPIIAWFDQRSLPQAIKMEKILGINKVFKISGLEINPIFSVPKIMWIRENAPEAYVRTTKWLSMTDYIIFKLTGEIISNYSIASRTMALDVTRMIWSEELLDAVGIDSNLFPDLKSSGVVVGKVNKNAAKETGLLSGTLVVNGGHDHFCGSLVSGVLLGNRVLDSSGTAESISAILKQKTPPTSKYYGFRIGRYLDPEFIYAVGGIIASGGAIDWFKGRIASLSDWDKPGNISYDIINRKAKETSLGAKGLLFLPHLRGGGAPNWDPTSHGVLIGLKTTHTAPEIFRALIEGLCFEVKGILETAKVIIGYPIEIVTVIGGGAKNEFWQQTKANIAGITVEVLDIEEATAMGAALLAGIGAGVYKDMLSASKLTYRVKKRYYPDKKANDYYKEIYHTYSKLYPVLKNINYDLSSLLNKYKNIL